MYWQVALLVIDRAPKQLSFSRAFGNNNRGE